MILVWSRKAIAESFAHTEEVSGDGRVSEQLTFAETRELT